MAYPIYGTLRLLGSCDDNRGVSASEPIFLRIRQQEAWNPLHNGSILIIACPFLTKLREENIHSLPYYFEYSIGNDEHLTGNFPLPTDQISRCKNIGFHF